METTIVPTKTEGVSPKTVLAGVLPALGTVFAVLILWLVTGELNKAELAVALTGFSGSAFSALGAWLGSPGTVTVDLPQQGGEGAAAIPADVGPASDELLPPEAAARLTADETPPPSVE